jgi:decaprenylphospho-beta-D-erythro-pentofuranosid-2-ulose 2-reductase
MKNVLIIGANSAIARACAREWAVQGAKFFLVGRDATKLASVAADLQVRGANAAIAWQMDVVDFGAHAAMLEAAVAELSQIDLVLIAHGTLAKQIDCELDSTISVQEFTNNATSVIALLTIVANQLSRQGHGAIGVITSVAGDRGRASNYVYGSAKAAVATFCEGLRARLFKQGITVTDIRPGFVATPMTQDLPLPKALVVKPEAIAGRIISGIESGKAVLYVPWFWSVVMWIIRRLPRFVFHRLKL